MPGCKIDDNCFVIAQYSDVPAETVGTFHTVVQPCACNPGWWVLDPAHPCIGHVANATLLGQPINLCMPVRPGINHCAPDACLQPIRPGASPVEAPAPVRMLELDHQPS